MLSRLAQATMTFAKPYDHTFGVLIYLAHALDLAGLLIVVYLVDAHLVDPEDSSLVRAPQRVNRTTEVVVNGAVLAMDAHRNKGATAPCVAQALVLISLPARNGHVALDDTVCPRSPA